MISIALIYFVKKNSSPVKVAINNIIIRKYEKYRTFDLKPSGRDAFANFLLVAKLWYYIPFFQLWLFPEW